MLTGNKEMKKLVGPCDLSWMEQASWFLVHHLGDDPETAIIWKRK
jgi:hypothetical protein